MAKHARERPSSLRVVRPELPEHAEEAVHQALQKKPEERPATGGGELARLLDSS